MAENGSSYEFPCEIPVKVFGRNDEAFRAAVRQIVATYFPEFDHRNWKERASRESAWLSITLVLMVDSQYQIDGLYTELSAHADVKMAL